MAFPTTGILDNFNRANTGPPPSGSWGANGPYAGSSTLAVVSNAAKDTNIGGNGGYWNTSFGPDVEMYMTFSILLGDGRSNSQYVRIASPGSGSPNAYRVLFNRVDSNPGYRILFHRIDSGAFTQLGADFNDTSGVISAGIKFGTEMIGSTLSAYVNKSGSWVLQDQRTDSTYSAAGFEGLIISDDVGAIDDFGGGTVVAAVDTGLAWIKA